MKLKVQVSNQSKVDISIEAGRFRLITPSFTKSSWTPRMPTGVLISRDGNDLVPPNADGSFERLDGSYTFATHWSEKELGAGASYRNNAVKQGDLVFYIPIGTGQSVQVEGIALLDNRDQIIADLPLSSFGKVQDANAF